MRFVTPVADGRLVGDPRDKQSWGYFKYLGAWATGVTLWRDSSGVWHESIAPYAGGATTTVHDGTTSTYTGPDEGLATAEVVYEGGYVYDIDDAEEAELVAEFGGSELVLGGSGFASSPHYRAFDITGDIDVRALVSLSDWASSSPQVLAGKYATSNDQRSWQFVVAPPGDLQFQWSTTGAAQPPVLSTATLGFSNGSEHWVRATLDVDNGAGGNTVRFYTAPAGTRDWVQLGADKVRAGTTSIYSSSTPLTVGARLDGGAPAVGSFHRVEVYDAGSLVADPDFRFAPVGATEVTDSFGNKFTLAGSAAVA